VQLFTRTPGFWKNRPDLTQSVLTAAGGLTVCGQLIDDVAADDAHSALEALCGPDQGVDRFQCCRQLMAASLNLAAGGASFVDLASCNAICADPSSAADAVAKCEGDADAFNNSNDNVSTPFPEGSADPNACKDAANTACTIVDPTSCATQ
jgi:hypothetical protein